MKNICHFVKLTLFDIENLLMSRYIVFVNDGKNRVGSRILGNRITCSVIDGSPLGLDCHLFLMDLLGSFRQIHSELTICPNDNGKVNQKDKENKDTEQN